MSKVAKRHWRGGDVLGMPRRDRQGCDYETYVPDPLVGRVLRLDGDVAADVADAETALARFDERATALADTEAVARLLLRAESIASSKIEGLVVGGRRLLRAEAAQAMGAASSDVSAIEVLANIDAMAWALQTINVGDDITMDMLLGAHRRLLADSSLAAQGGRLRAEQNWIGGSGYNPCSAAYIPPPPELVAELMRDLCSFCNSADLSPVTQAAVAHAQFETIHPFVDGNGRIGRVLIHLVLRRRGLATRVSPPISLILATWSKDYVAGLTATRYRGGPNSGQAVEGLNRWIGVFASACARAIGDAESFESQISQLQAQWRERLGAVRKGSAVAALIAALPGAPIITANSATTLTKRSFQATNQAIARLVDAQVLTQIKVGRRNRAFESAEVMRRFTDLERRLASVTGDTRTALPTRVVPRL